MATLALLRFIDLVYQEFVESMDVFFLALWISTWFRLVDAVW